MARKINDYLSTFFPAEALNEANQQARFQYDYPNLSQQMTHNQYAAPYQQFQQEYPQLEQYARDVLSGRVAKRGLQELSSNLNQAIQGNPQALEPYIGFGGMTAFHGSPHKFGKFLMDKIGAGEGAQAYGHGLYFAESPDVAKAYSRVVSDKGGWDVGNAPPRAQLSEKSLNRIKDTANFANIEARYFRDGPEAAKQMAKEAFDNSRGTPYSDAFHELAYKVDWEKSPGSFYEVDIPDEQINKMLDWDAPLSEQNEIVRKTVGDNFGLRKEVDGHMTGEEIYHYISSQTQGNKGPWTTFGKGNSQQAGSELLNSLGIPGIKYFDQASRGAGEGTRNFVVFDEDLVKILDRK